MHKYDSKTDGVLPDPQNPTVTVKDAMTSKSVDAELTYTIGTRTLVRNTVSKIFYGDNELAKSAYTVDTENKTISIPANADVFKIVR